MSLDHQHGHTDGRQRMIPADVLKYHANRINDALRNVERDHPNSRSVTVLHGVLDRALADAAHLNGVAAETIVPVPAGGAKQPPSA